MAGDVDSPDSLDVARLRAGRPKFGGSLAALKLRVVATATGRRRAIAGRYVLGRILGTGASGTVFEAEDTELQRKVALKLVKASTEAQIGRVVREAQTLAQLSHPNVVQVFEVGMPEEDTGAPYVVMELVEGVTLQRWLAERPRATGEVVAVIVQAARGLQAAHGVGIVHRDFKPANVLIGRDGRVRVVDFGLARPDVASVVSLDIAELASTLDTDGTATGALVGTPAYMAPEAFAGESSPASDQYSLCLVLYEALVGQRPHDCDSLEELVELRLEVDATVPRAKRIPRRWVRVIERGLRRDPSRRYRDLAALVAALEGGRRYRTALMVAGGAAVAAGLLVAATRPEPRCVTGRAAWDGLLEMNAFRDVIREPLTRHIDAWLATEAQRCAEAEGALDPATRSCLQARIGEARALVEAGRTLDLLDHAGVARALEVLGDPSACGGQGDRASTMTPRERTAAVQLAQHKVERLRELCDRSENEAALSLARELLPEARAIGFAPLLVETASLAAHASLVTADYEAARAHNEDCYFAAKHAALDWWSAGCASTLIMVTGDYLGDSAQARVWAKRAAAGFERTGSEAMKELNYVQGVLRVARREGDYAEQERLARVGLSIVETLTRPEHRRTDTMLAYLGEAQAGQGNHEGAVQTFTEAVRLKREANGDGSVAEAQTLNQRGHSLAALGRKQEALENHREALRIREAALSPGAVELAESHKSLAPLLAELGRGAEALWHAERALDLLREHHGDDSEQVGDAHRIRGDVYRALGRRDEGLAAYRQARTILAGLNAQQARLVEERIAAWSAEP